MEIKPSFKFVNQYTEDNKMIVYRKVKDNGLMTVYRRTDEKMINPIIRMYPVDDKYVEMANQIDIDEVIYRDEVRAIK